MAKYTKDKQTGKLETIDQETKKEIEFKGHVMKDFRKGDEVETYNVYSKRKEITKIVEKEEEQNGFLVMVTEGVNLVE